MAVEGTTPGEAGLYYDMAGHKQRWSVSDQGEWKLEQEWVKDEDTGQWEEIEVPEAPEETIAEEEERVEEEMTTAVQDKATGGYDNKGFVAWGDREVPGITGTSGDNQARRHLLAALLDC